MEEIKRPFQVFNGTDWDTCFFDTDESLINTGFNQDIDNTTGGWKYKKFPGNLVITWHKINANTLGAAPGIGGYSIKIKYPFAFSGIPSVFVTAQYTGGFPRVAVHSTSSTDIIIGADTNNVNAWICVVMFGKVE